MRRLAHDDRLYETSKRITGVSIDCAGAEKKPVLVFIYESNKWPVLTMIENQPQWLGIKNRVMEEMRRELLQKIPELANVEFRIEFRQPARLL